MRRPGLRSSPPFSPAESVAVGAATGSKKEGTENCRQRQRAHQEPGISQRDDEKEGFKFVCWVEYNIISDLLTILNSFMGLFVIFFLCFDEMHAELIFNYHRQ
jgi:hypothetical protein